MHITPIGPRKDNTEFAISGDHQSTAGKELCIACSPNGARAYLGGHAGIWRSIDGGVRWQHLEWPQPNPSQARPPGALPVTNVYDLWVHPEDPDIVLAAVGRDFRRPEASGVYRSVNGGADWVLAHRFLGSAGPVMASTFAGAPDVPDLVFAASRVGLAVSEDGGSTWRDITVAASVTLDHVLVGPLEAGARHVYATGSSFWHSADGGVTWRLDPGGPGIGPPTDAVGESSRATCLHPTNPRIVYARRAFRSDQITIEELWKGSFPADDGPGLWTLLPNPPVGYPGTTASGGSFVLAHRSPAGQLLLIVSDRRTTHLAVGEPDVVTDWVRIDGDPVHVDPHGIAASLDFRRGPQGPSMGRLFLVSDGGAYVSVNGAHTWIQGRNLSTLGLVNAAVLSVEGEPRGICLQSGDNSGFYSRDGGASWATQDYLGGDNDCTFADPRQPDRLIVFAPRAGNREIFLYVDPSGGIPDASVGTAQRRSIKGPPREPDEDDAPWTAVSPFYFAGYRPLVLTLADEQPRPDGDFVVIWARFAAGESLVLRTTKLSTLTTSEDWVTSATSDGPGVKVFRQGPALPVSFDVVQPSGGHTRPTFTVGESSGARRAQRWRSGMTTWATLVPAPGRGPRQAIRFFVDPYRPQLVYVLDTDHVWRTDDGGGQWVVDAELERALTLDGFSFSQRGGNALLRDMAFDPRGSFRFAAGPRGVFHSLDGEEWRPLALSTALSAQANGMFYDPGVTPCDRSLYVSTTARGLLRLHPLPPEWDTAIGSMNAATGRVSELRVHERGSGFGPPTDRLETEVVVRLDTDPRKAFGFRLLADDDEPKARGQLDMLRDAFRSGHRLRLEYVRTGCRTGTLVRVIAI